MAVVVPVYFDYASALCFIAWRIGLRLEAELAVVMQWRPVHIAAQYPGWTAGRRIDDDARARIARVSVETGVSLRIPACWPESRAALEGSVFARERDRLALYHDAVFAAAYERGEDIGDRAVLVRAAREAGLPLGDFMEAIATRRGAAELAATLDEARQRGVVGYPTFMLGEFPLTGIQTYDTMQRLMLRHLERHGERLLH